MVRRFTGCALSMVWLLFNAGGLSAQTPTTWNGSVSTVYNNSSNWSNGIANGNFSATIPGTGTATNQPTLSGTDTVSVLNLTDATSALTIADNSTLAVNTNAVTGAGTINNTGTLSLNSAGNTTALQMTGGVGTVTLSGTGTLMLNDRTTNVIVSANAGSTFANASNITGAGAFTDAVSGQESYALTNSGIITATGSNSLIVNTGGLVTNTGTLQATNGTLNLQGNSVANTGGFIVANGGGTVQLTGGVTVSGGTLTNSGGTLTTVNGDAATLSGVTLSAGQFLVNDNSTLFLAGGTSLTNNGTVAVNSAGNTTRLELTGTNQMVTIGGTGTVALNDRSTNQIVSQSTGNTLINDVHSTIQGAGSFTSSGVGIENYTLQNNGTITALGSNALIVNPGAGVTNTATMQAGNGTATGTLSLTGDTFTNTGGLILANTGSTVNLTGGAAIVGGTLQNLGSGVLTTVGASSATVNGVTINGGSTLNVADNSSLFLTGGSTLTNNGTLAMNSAGNATRLQMTGTNAMVTLGGTGAVAMNDNSNNQIVADNTGMTLINGVSQTIQGAGTFNSPSGAQNYTLQNNGTITALGSNALIVNPGGGVTNTATMQAGNGTSTGILTLTGDTFTNTGGLILANTGSTVNLAGGATIVGGTLQNLGSGVLTTVSASTATVNGVTIQAGSTLNVHDDSSLFLTGGSTLTNNGTLAVNSAGNTTRLQMTGTGQTVTLGGTGTVAMNDNSNNQIVADNTGMTLINGVSHTIQGAGTFNSPSGAQNYTLQNNGTITALGSNALIVNPAAGVTNTATMQAGNGTSTGILTLTGDTFTNTGGLILANTGSTVNLTGGATIVGGNLENLGTGVLTTVDSSSATLNGVTIQSASTLNVHDHSTLFLTGGSTLTNNGTLAVNSAGNTTRLELTGTGQMVTISGTGTATLNNNSNNQIVADSTGMTLVNDVNHTIQGSGAFTDALSGTQAYTLNNNGTITANSSNGLVVNPGGTVNNTGTIQATSGGTLILESNLYSQTGNGTIYANGGNVDMYNGTSITGGTLQTSGTSLIQTISGNTAQFSGALTITTGSNVQVSDDSVLQLAGGNTFTNNGNININSAGNATKLTLVGSGTVTLAGTGSVTSNNSSNDFITANTTGLALTNGDAHTISGSEVFTSQGSGNQNYNLTNKGVLLANQSNAMQILPGGSVTNTGVMQANAGSLLHLENTGGTTFTNFSGNTLAGGTYVANGGTVQIDQLGTGGGEIVNNAATIVLVGTTSQFLDSTGLDALSKLGSNSDSFSILGGRNFNTPGGFTNTGFVDIGTGDTFSVNLSVSPYLQTDGITEDDGTLGPSETELNGGFLEGVGTVDNALLVDGGTVAPGDPPGTLNINGLFDLEAGDLLIGLAGTSMGDYDSLNVNGEAELGGTLEFDLQDGFNVASGDTFVIADYTSRLGEFATDDFSGLDLAAGLSAQVLYDQGAGDNEVVLSITGTSATPEPSTWFLFAGGLGALALFQISRKRRANAK